MILYFVFNDKFRLGLGQSLVTWKLAKPRTRNVIPRENFGLTNYDTGIKDIDYVDKSYRRKDWNDTIV